MPQSKSLRKKAWRIFSKWVRSHNADFAGYINCYTCGKKVNWKYECNAGHYRHDSYDFDERNVKPQCIYCNLGESGRADNFYLHLVKDYGKDEAEELRTRAKWNDYSTQELEEIVTKYDDRKKILS